MIAIYETRFITETNLVAVADTEAAAKVEIDKLRTEAIRQEIDCSVDPDEERSEWEQDLLERGVPAETVKTLEMPESVLTEARKRAEDRVAESIQWSTRPVRKV